jgi:hypothetical protein
MNAPDTLVRRYLDALDRALAGVPEAQRWEIVDDVTEHIRTSRSELPDDGSEAQVRTILDRLGDPELIAARAREESGERPAPRPAAGGLRDTIALLLLTLGALLLPLVGPAAGTLLVASSPRWSGHRKLMAYVVPLVLLTAFTVLVFLFQGFWRADVVFYALVLVPAGAGVALAVPPAPRPISATARTAGQAAIGAVLVALGLSDMPPLDVYALVLLVVLAAVALGRFGLGEPSRRPVAV